VRIHVREGGDDLVLGREIGALLEFEVADCARQGEVAIDTTEVDKSTSSRDTVLLRCEPS